MMVIDDWNVLVKGSNDEIVADFICAVKSAKGKLSMDNNDEDVIKKMKLYFEIGMMG